MTRRHGGRDLERQALDVLYAVRGVAERLRHRRQLLQAPLSPSRHVALREDILYDLDRLSNLVELAEESMRPEFRKETQQAILRTLTDLRDRNQGLGIGLAFEKIQELRAVAEETASASDHPLGRSLRMKDEFLKLVSYLRTLTSELSPDLNRDLQTSAHSINVLIDRDRHNPWLKELGDADEGLDSLGLVSFIDPEDVVFPVSTPPEDDGPAPGDDNPARREGDDMGEDMRDDGAF